MSCRDSAAASARAVPGESKLETDRRHLKRRVEQLSAELDRLDRARMTQRSARERSGIVKCAIVGYTNAGKSTLLNRLTDAGILAEDKLFATLDPTTRKFALPSGVDILLTDTVGFIRNLPHHLIKAFKSTLDEAVYADIIIIIIDASDPEAESQLAVTENLLEELGAAGKPTIRVFNKCDRFDDAKVLMSGFETGNNEVAAVSALTGEGIDDFVAKLERMVLDGKTDEVFRIPNSDAGVLNRLYCAAKINNVEYGDEYLTVSATVDAKTRGQYAKYLEQKQIETAFDDEDDDAETETSEDGEEKDD